MSKHDVFSVWWSILSSTNTDWFEYFFFLPLVQTSKKEELCRSCDHQWLDHGELTLAIFRKGCDHSDNVILYRWVVFTVGGTYSCNVTFVLLSHIWARICVSTETFLLIVVALKPLNVNLVVWVQRKSASGNNECLYALFANPSDVLIFLCLSGADKSHQDSSLGHRGYQCLDSWQSPEWPFIETKCSTQSGARWKSGESPNVDGIIANHHVGPRISKCYVFRLIWRDWRFIIWKHNLEGFMSKVRSIAAVMCTCCTGLYYILVLSEF